MTSRMVAKDKGLTILLVLVLRDLLLNDLGLSELDVELLVVLDQMLSEESLHVSFALVDYVEHKVQHEIEC